MVTYYKLDKVFVQGTTYELPKDRFYVIEKIGTDQNTDTYLKIDGVDLGGIINRLAPLYSTSTNELPPLDLGNLKYVVPPEKQFTVVGAAGAKMRCIGRMGVLAPGETMPGDLLARFNAQGKHYLDWIQFSKAYTTNYTWANNEEIEIGALTPKTVEKYIFNNIVECESGVTTLTWGQAGLVIDLEGTRLDILTNVPGKKGIDLMSFPRPPTYDGVNVPGTFKEFPVIVEGDRTISFKFINQSGGNLTVDATVDQWIEAIVEVIKQ